jgi:SAM-dependent MidA family methyltransferase
MTPLAQQLAQRILEDGPMPFSSFMAAALYHPELGYYSSQKLRTGRAGDFFTSVSVGPVFGQLMAGEICAAWERLGKPDQFSIIEAGANNGQFALDVLTWAQAHRPDFLAVLDYQIDEPLASAEAMQRRKLEPFASHVTHNAATPVAHGCYFANELLDAVPCRRVRFREGRWWELRVGLDHNGQFSWHEHEPEDGALLRRLAWLGLDFPEGYTTEIAPAVASHLRLAAGRVEQGYLFFADYGYPARDYYALFRTTGTLRCYREHQAHEDPFDAVGETDLTAHVDFSLAADAAVRSGCEVLGFLDQSRFLTAAATPALRQMEEQGAPAGTAWLRQFQTLTHPAHLGQKFHFLVLGKNVRHLDPLPSLAFARPSSVAELLHPDLQPAESPE